MTDISVIGLGAMGGALANAFLRAEHKVTVWNRSPEKMNPFIASGADAAHDLIGAVQSSPIIIVCIDNYSVTERLFEDSDACSHLSGKTLIQLSTGTPKEAQESSAWVRRFGGIYIDGAIMPYPDGIGKDDSRLLFAGPKHSYQQCLPFLTCLGGDLQYLGENIRAAAVLDMALLTRELCGHLATVHGALICESENVSIETLASMLDDGDPDRHLAEVIHSESYENPGATITVWNNALQRIQSQAADRSINSEVPNLVSSILNRAITAGFGEEDFAAIIKVMRVKN